MFQCRKKIGHVCLFCEGIFFLAFYPIPSKVQRWLKSLQTTLCMLGPDVLVLLKSVDSVIKEESQTLLWKSLLAFYLQRSPGTVGLKCLSYFQFLNLIVVLYNSLSLQIEAMSMPCRQEIKCWGQAALQNNTLLCDWFCHVLIEAV